MVVSVGEAAALAAALPEIAGLLERPLVTWERVRVCKRDGVTLDTPEPAEGDAWQKIMVYGGHPLYRRARALAARAPARRARRRCAASGATTAITPRTARAPGSCGGARRS